ncbi:MAG: hypothetical protein KME49_22955 [Brasilonema octagenarum HA4186-MV1]|jgi:hypothetical protein|nr:hypothetical protein [Brasilonema octagenarum HA4186-MV1]
MKLQETVAGQPKDVDLGYPTSATPYFNGSSDQIDIPYATDINPTSFTVEMWVLFQRSRGYRAILTSVSGSATLGRRGYVFCVNAAQQWQFWLGSGQIGIPWVILTGSKAQRGIWTHLTGTYDSVSKTMAFYINGLAVGQYTGIPFQPNNRHPLHVGAGATEAGASSCFFYGSITKVRIWAEALSPVEIQTLAIEGVLGDQTVEQTVEPTSPIPTPVAQLKQPEVTITSPIPTPVVQVKQPEIPITSPIPTPVVQVKQPEIPITSPIPTPVVQVKQPEVPITSPIPTPIAQAKQPEVTITSTIPTPVAEVPITSPIPTPIAQVKQPEVPITSPIPTPVAQVKQPEVPITSPIPTPVAQVKQPEVPIASPIPTPIAQVKQPEVPIASPTPTPLAQVKQPEVPAKPLATTPPESSEIKPLSKELEKCLQPVLTFDGQDDYVEIPYSPTLDFAQAQDFAIEVWLKPDAMEETKSKTTFDINVLEKWVGTPFPYAIRYSSKNGRVYASRYDDDKKHPAVSCLQPIDDRQFHHVAFVKQSSQLYLYVDGVEVASTNDTTIGTTQNDSPLYLSRGAVGGRRHFFKGHMTEFRMWNRSRSQVEIQADMSRRLAGNEPGLVGYWPLSEGSGDTVIDKTKNANHGKITGATWKQVEVPIS